MVASRLTPKASCARATTNPASRFPAPSTKFCASSARAGWASFYDVEDTTIGKRSVLKTLHPRFGAREDLVRRIQNEARTLARLHHPNIVEVITAGVTSDDLRLPYYVMERLSGQSLRAHSGEEGAARAFARVPHRNRSARRARPRSRQGRNSSRRQTRQHFPAPDAGGRDGHQAARLRHRARCSTIGRARRGAAFLGTLRYAAPEQLRGEKPTPKTDVYSAGLVLYEVIAGHGPFDDEGDASRIAAAHMNQPPPPVSPFATVPRGLDDAGDGGAREGSGKRGLATPSRSRRACETSIASTKTRARGSRRTFG